jgi:hypothetical protein
MLSASLVFETLWKIFEDMLSDESLRSVNILLDGLDECDDPLLLNLLEKLQCLMKAKSKTSTTILKLIVVSRITPTFLECFSEFS